MPTSHRKRHEDAATLNLTSMIDVTFLLIIFFLCVAEMARVEYEKLVLPKAAMGLDGAPNPTNRQIINVVRHREGDRESSRVIVRGRQYERVNDLVALLRAACERSAVRGEEPVSVKIRADSGAAYQEVQKVMVACMKAGINRVSIGTVPDRN